MEGEACYRKKRELLDSETQNGEGGVTETLWGTNIRPVQKKVTKNFEWRA